VQRQRKEPKKERAESLKWRRSERTVQTKRKKKGWQTQMGKNEGKDKDKGQRVKKVRKRENRGR